MGFPASRRRFGPLRSISLAIVCACLWAAAGVPGSARAEACPGSGRAPYCPYVSVQSIGQRGESVLRFPEAVAVDTAGNVYVADQLSYIVQKFTAAGAFETQWGSYGGGHGQFGPIGGLATDAAGNVYVVDSSHNRIQKFDPNGAFLASWGGRGSELGRFNFGSSQNYTQPPGGGIAVGGNYVYVADSGNHRIERFNLSGGEALQWGTYGSLPGQFSYPRGLAANAGEVLVADDDNHRVQKFSPDGAFEAEAGTHGSGPGQFGFPYGVALDAAGNAYVADDLNHRVVKLSPQLGFLGAWGGYGSQPGQLAFPRALASDAAGDTYVADTANGRVQVYDTNGNYLRTLGASARGPGQMTGPRGLATDPTGRLLVSDTVDNRIELFAPAGGPYVGQWTKAGAAAAGFNAPAAIGVEELGSVYVADQGNARVVHLWGDGTFLGELAGSAALGGAQPGGAQPGGAQPGAPPPGAAQPGSTQHPPNTVAVDGAGREYVLDAKNNRVQVFGADGQLFSEWGARGIAPGDFSQPSAIAVDCSGAVYVADTNNNRVQRFDLASPAPTGCLPAGSWPPPLNVAPVLRVSLLRTGAVLSRRALALTVSCARGCSILATGALTPLGRHGGARLVGAARALPAARAGHVRLRVGPQPLRRLRRALGRRRAMRARVRIVATGLTGLPTTVTRTYTVTR
jgi:tripartite motif-containing protein 71